MFNQCNGCRKTTFELGAGINAAVGAELLDTHDTQKLAAEPDGPKPFDSKANRLQTLADLSLNGAVAEGWREVELATISAALPVRVTPRGARVEFPGVQRLRSFQAEGMLSASTNDLSRRTQSAHEQGRA